MYCTTEGCAWKGELTSQRITPVGAVIHCGLCMKPTADAEPEGDDVTRRDEDAEGQEELAEKADQEAEDAAQESAALEQAERVAMDAGSMTGGGENVGPLPNFEENERAAADEAKYGTDDEDPNAMPDPDDTDPGTDAAIEADLNEPF